MAASPFVLSREVSVCVRVGYFPRQEVFAQGCSHQSDEYEGVGRRYEASNHHPSRPSVNIYNYLSQG
jgi:hypothetical protein